MYQWSYMSVFLGSLGWTEKTKKKIIEIMSYVDLSAIFCIFWIFERNDFVMRSNLLTRHGTKTQALGN